MNRKELIKAISRSADISTIQADKAIRGFEQAVTGALSRGKDVTLVGFGRFSAVKRAARKCRNPQTGEKMHIPAKKVAVFKAGKGLKNAVID